MTALTVAAATAPCLPELRRLPVPVAEPRPALRVVPERALPHAGEPAGDQGVLTLPDPAADRRNDGHPDGGPRRVPPPAAAWARQFVQMALEAATGRRPVSQLLRWSSEDVYALLTRRAALAARLDRCAPAVARCSVLSLHLRPLTAEVVEACAVVTDRGRVRAVALRLEDANGRWRVTALEIG